MKLSLGERVFCPVGILQAIFSSSFLADSLYWRLCAMIAFDDQRKLHNFSKATTAIKIPLNLNEYPNFIKSKIIDSLDRQILLSYKN